MSILKEKSISEPDNTELVDIHKNGKAFYLKIQLLRNKSEESGFINSNFEKEWKLNKNLSLHESCKEKYPKEKPINLGSIFSKTEDKVTVLRLKILL